MFQTQPWNLMIKHRPIQKRGRRSHLSVSYTDPQISMELLRVVLQPSLNQEILQVFNKYHQVLPRSTPEYPRVPPTAPEYPRVPPTAPENPLLPQSTPYCPRVLPQSTPYCPREPPTAPEYPLLPQSTPYCPRVPPTAPEYPQRTPPYCPREPPYCPQRTPYCPRWDPNRLSDSSTFVLGSRANKALGMGGTRGRIYIKHADLFKYAADAKDKQWLAERHHMRATGGKMAYLLIEEDIQDLAQSDEYKDCPDVRMDEMKPFSVPVWMVEKMQRAMEAQRDAVSDP
ncbi:hypothetical protein NL108_016893 [Boleophthalmus pectinirostris]|nr:hypothetical protein NL108_016893 [Boleophthalmus pectinirostris]